MQDDIRLERKQQALDRRIEAHQDEATKFFSPDTIDIAEDSIFRDDGSDEYDSEADSDDDEDSPPEKKSSMFQDARS